MARPDTREDSRGARLMGFSAIRPDPRVPPEAPASCGGSQLPALALRMTLGGHYGVLDDLSRPLGGPIDSRPMGGVGAVEGGSLGDPLRRSG